MGGESAFRWLDAVRYAVATMVTVLVVAVIVNAIKVVLRPDSPRLWVVQGSVSVYTRSVPAQKVVELGLNLRTENPSGRARIYFLNISVYLFDNKTVESTTTDPEEDCIIFFPVEDVVVAQQAATESILQVNVTSDEDTMEPFYFRMLYEERGVIEDAAMRVNGTLVTEVRSGINRTRPGMIYHCWPLVIGGSPSDNTSTGRQDTRCMERVQTYGQLDE